MNHAELLALASRAEAADGPDRALDWEIHLRNGLEGVGMYGAHPACTASVDAALMLVSKGHRWSVSNFGSKHFAQVEAHCGRAKTHALAIVVASLRALAEEIE